QHRTSNNALAREVMDAEAMRLAAGRHESGPISVVKRVFPADVAETIELRRRLQRHDDVVVGRLERRTETPGAEHAVARGEAVHVQRFGAVAARGRRADGQTQREPFARAYERGRRRDAFGSQKVGRADL